MTAHSTRRPLISDASRGLKDRHEISQRIGERAGIIEQVYQEQFGLLENDVRYERHSKCPWVVMCMFET